MIGMDDFMVSVHGECTAIGVVYDCEFEPKATIVCPPATIKLGTSTTLWAA